MKHTLMTKQVPSAIIDWWEQVLTAIRGDEVRSEDHPHGAALEGGFGIAHAAGEIVAKVVV